MAPVVRMALQSRHNERDGVSIHQPHDCLLNRLFRRRYQRNHQSSTSLAFVTGIHRWPVNFPHKGPVTRRMFPFDDVINVIMVLFKPTKTNILSFHNGQQSESMLENDHYLTVILTYCDPVVLHGIKYLGHHWFRYWPHAITRTNVNLLTIGIQVEIWIKWQIFPLKKLVWVKCRLQNDGHFVDNIYCW